MLAFLALFAVLFPSPLHLTREVTDPITGTTSVIEEYCHGDRVVSVSGRRTSIAEYDKGVLTTIDFAAGTYSVTSFDDLARAWSAGPRAGAGKSEVQVTPDPQQRTLSREAVEVLLGTAWPNRPDPAADKMLGALRSRAPRVAVASAAASGPSAEYAIPVEQVMHVDAGGQSIEMRNTVIRIGSELVPPDLLTVPPGARLVEDSALAVRRMADELDGRRN